MCEGREGGKGVRKSERREDEKMRSEGCAVDGRQNVLNNYDHHSSLRVTISRTCEANAHLKVHTLHALGEHDLVDSSWGGKAKRGRRMKLGMRKHVRLAAKTY